MKLQELIQMQNQLYEDLQSLFASDGYQALTASWDSTVEFLNSPEKFQNLTENLNQAICTISENFQNADSITLSSDKLVPFKKLEEFVPVEKRNEYQEIVALPKGEKSKVLTLDNFYKLATIILAILALVRPVSLDNESKALLHTGNELNAEKIELIKDFFDYIKENGLCFHEENLLVQNEVQDVVDLIDPECQNDNMQNQEND